MFYTLLLVAHTIISIASDPPVDVVHGLKVGLSFGSDWIKIKTAFASSKITEVAVEKI